MNKHMKRLLILMLTALMLVCQFRFDRWLSDTSVVNASTAQETDKNTVRKGRMNNRNLSGSFILGKGSTIMDSLDGDWAYVSRFEIDRVTDGTAPFDTSDDPDSISYKNRQGNDENDSNGIVRTFDTVTYELSYSTMTYEYLGVEKGYLYYEFVLPYAADQAQWELNEMVWVGNKVNSIAELEAKNDGESYYCLETKTVDGIMSQVLTGKRYLVAVSPNPSAFPGSGTLEAVLRVLNMNYGTTVAPKFKVWLDHNHTDGTCPEHGAVEVKSLDAATDPDAAVTVTSELRLNVQLRDVSPSHANGVDDFDFSTGNDLAMNKTAGIVYGRLVGYGITLQLYNLDPADGLKGVAVPTGPITFDVDLKSEYKKSNNTIVSDLPDIYTPLVWTYEGHIGNEDQLDGRILKQYGGYPAAVYAAPYSPAVRTLPMGTYSDGSLYVWNGGVWTGSQTGNKVSFTVDEYVINPNFFPNANAYNALRGVVYYDSYEGVRSTNIGCFSAGELFVIVPFGNDDKYLEDIYGEGSINVTINDYNLRADSSAGSLPVDETGTSNQTKPNRSTLPLEDDEKIRNVSLSMKGTYSNLMLCTSSRAILGQRLNLIWGIAYNPNGEKRNAVYGFNALLKFDSTGFEIDGEPYNNLRESMVSTYLYAVKPDGKAWESDTEMDEAVESDLVYYKTLEEAQANGIVVGILVETRSDNPEAIITNAYHYVPVRIKADAEVKKVYQAVERTYIWIKKHYDDAGGVIPRRYDNIDGVVYPAAYWVDYSPGPYTKAVYDVDGNLISNGRISGISVYVTSYRVTIKKEIAQKAGGSEKQVYDLDSSQRFVDFRLKPSFQYLLSGQSATADFVEIKEVLPKGLRYIPGSSYLGGTYTQNPIAGRRGTVTGGEQIEPVVVPNPDTGETTIKWVFQNVNVVNGPLPEIIFSAYIGEPGSPNDVVNNQTLVSTVTISATEDRREALLANKNYAESSFQVARLSSTSLVKIPDSRFIEVDGEIGWKAYVSNNGSSAFEDTVILDVLPYNGDAGGTAFDDTAKKIVLDGWAVDTALSNVGDLSSWRFFYTTDVAVQGTLSAAYTAAGIIAGSSGGISWSEATVNLTDGKISGMSGDITALAAVGTLNAGETLVQDIDVSTDESLEAGEIIANTMSRESDEVCSAVYVIKRTLEGLMWNDVNEDGIRQLTESLITEGTVSLLYKNTDGDYVPCMCGGSPVSLQLGKQMDINTGVISDYEEGKYRFVGLPAGTFEVRFVRPRIGDYYASPLKAGSEYTDSDAAGEYDGVSGLMKYTSIKGIEMPSKDVMATASYRSGFNDSGVYLRKVDVEVEKVWNDGNNQDGKRPATVTVKLLTDENDTGKTVTLNETNSWSDSFDDLPEYDNGRKIVYTIEELSLNNGYTSAVSGSVADGFTVTNTRNPETTSRKVSLVWDDNNDQDGLRDNVTLKLVATADGEEVTWTDLKNASASGAQMDEDGLVTLISKADESHTFTNLPVYYMGKKVTYSVLDTTVIAGYTESLNQSTLTVTKTHTPETVERTVSVVWNDSDNQDGKRTAVTLKLVATVEGTEVAWSVLRNASASKLQMDADGLVKLTSKADESHTFRNLPAFYQGSEVSYTLLETAVPEGYTESYNQETLTVTNSRTPETVSIAGSATWVDDDDARGVRPAVITVRLYRNGVEIDSMDVSDIGGVWSWDFGVYPKYANGKLIEYTITEDAIAEYRISIKGFNVTNTHLDKVPFTGDDFNIGLWIGVMLLSLAALAGVTAYRYKTTRK
ncbi:MAG: Cna B-type domain-containing protein [Erysipelotrichaceae bacterium]